MSEKNNDYEVRCNTCYKKFTIQLFESHDKNLWLVDKKDWYCETCKNEYFEKQTSKLTKTHAKIGFPELNGTPQRISWAEKIRAELINKVDFFKKSLGFNDDQEKERSDLAFDLFLQQWQKETDAKWWIDNRNTTVRDISQEIKKIIEGMK
jgi:hypothetical protein